MSNNRKLIIKFYDKPEMDNQKFLLKDKDASIIYNHPPYLCNSDTRSFAAEDFVGYWKKISYEFRNDEDISLNLNNRINNLIENGTQGANILYDEKPGYAVKIVSDKLRAAKVYRADLEDLNTLPFSLVTLKRTSGGEPFYATKSVLIFFDYIIKNLYVGEGYLPRYRYTIDNFLNDVRKIYRSNLEDYLG